MYCSLAQGVIPGVVPKPYASTNWLRMWMLLMSLLSVFLLLLLPLML